MSDAVSETFDLEPRIAAWRAGLADREVGDAAIAELEDHLREHVAALRVSGLTDEEAFVVAAMRVGQPARLAAEVQRADPAGLWSRRLLWMIGGYFVCWGFSVLAGQLSTTMGVVGLALHMHPGLVIAAEFLLLSVVIGVVVAAVGWLGGGAPEGMLQRLTLPGWCWRWRWWCVAAVIFLVPWGVAALRIILYSIALPTFMQPADLGHLALVQSTTNLVLPAVAPLILVILARWLDQRATA